jgi:hyperosmotically inducible protein
MGRAASSGPSSSGSAHNKATPPADTTATSGGTQRAGSASTSSSSSRSAGQIEQDRQIATSVRSKLSADSSTKSLSVGVDAYQGVVSLHGAVSNAGERSAAERVTRSVAGVRDVRNELRVH